MTVRMPCFLVIDEFLPGEHAQAVLDRALAERSTFVSASVVSAGANVLEKTQRRSLRSSTGLGPLEAAFVAALHSRLDEACAATGLERFPVAHTETELTAHGDGAFYNLHIDTLTQANRIGRPTDRMLSAVWYAHRSPKGFTGGALALHPFGPGEPVMIEPSHNRLVLFPSITLHAVRPVSCPTGDFADYRFAVNCWFHRVRPEV